MRIGAVKEPGEGGAAWRCKGRAVGESESGGLKLNNVVFVAELDWRWFALLSELVLRLLFSTKAFHQKKKGFTKGSAT